MWGSNFANFVNVMNLKFSICNEISWCIYKSFFVVLSTKILTSFEESAMFFPFSVVRSSTSSTLSTGLDDLEATHRGIHRFIPRHNDEMALEIGDMIHVVEECDDLWCSGKFITPSLSSSYEYVEFLIFLFLSTKYLSQVDLRHFFADENHWQIFDKKVNLSTNLSVDYMCV